MTQPKRWPNEARWALEDVKAALLDMDVLARQTQEISHDPVIVMLQTNLRIKSRDAFTQLTLAEAGIYPKEKVA